METLWQDLRYGARMLAKSPGFTAVAVLTLALGIGANTAIFSVVNGVLLRPLPYEEPGQLVRVWNQFLSEGVPQLWLSEPELIYYRKNTRALEGIAVYTTGGANLTGQGEALRVTAANVSANFFPLLRVDAFLGRTFTPEEDTPGNDRVIVLGHGFWQRRFGGDPTIIGETVSLSDNPYTVIGVMPSGFAFPDGNVDLWTPIAIGLANPGNAGHHYLQPIARLKAGVTFGQGMADIQRTALQYARENYLKATDEQLQQFGWGAYLVPLHESVVGDVRPALLILLGAVGFVLLIACANVANLLLARAAVREKEVAIRAALGAGRGRIIRQLLTESILLGLVGGAAGLLLAFWSLRVLVALGPENLPRLEEIGIDAGVLGFTLGVSLLTGIVFGLVPALPASRPDLHESLKEGGRSAAGARHHRLRSLLVVSEVALALVLLIGAGLLIQSFSQLLAVAPGYQTENILTLRIALPRARYAEGHQIQSFYQQLNEKVKVLPGVESVGGISLLPLSGGSNSGTIWAENTPAHAATNPGSNFPHRETDFRSVTPGYLETMGMTLVQGRSFTESDDSKAPLAAIVDESFARYFWPNESPIGKRVAFATREPQWRTIVGVVRHAKHYGLNIDGREQIYFPHAQRPRRTMYLSIRTAGEPQNMLNSVREQVRSLDPNLPLFNVATMEERLAESVAQPRFNVLLLGIFAAVALVLAAVGIYGVMSYSVSQRTHEIGIPMALGAQPADVLKLVVRQGMVLTLIGVAAGLAASFALTRFLSSLLYGVSATDPVTFAGVALLLAAVALAASYLPAQRATKGDPLVALRYE